MMKLKSVTYRFIVTLLTYTQTDPGLIEMLWQLIKKWKAFKFSDGFLKQDVMTFTARDSQSVTG